MFIFDIFAEYYRLLIAAALIPPVAALAVIRFMDRAEPEPLMMLVKLYFRGLLAMIPIYLLEVLAEWLVNSFAWSEMTYLFLCYFCIPGIIEEGVKFRVLKRRTWRDGNFNYTFDAVVYAVFVSMGFASIENIMYVATSGGISVAIMRAMFAIPGHAMFAVFMGIFYARAKRCEAEGDLAGSKRALRGALVVPMIFHGLYDFLLVAFGGPVFYVYFALSAVIAVVMARNAAKNDTPIFPGMNFPWL